jgi:hypothetical protein
MISKWLPSQAMYAVHRQEAINIPPAQEMTTLEPLHQRFRRRQADQSVGLKSFSRTVVRGSSLDIPGGRCIDRENGDIGVS